MLDDALMYSIAFRLGMSTKLYTMNPKACSVIELYGILDPITRDWTDGLLSNIFREINKPTEKNERKYILFDGDVDALWVENMNSVMDDNKLLTLANGERIRLQKHCALLVEVRPINVIIKEPSSLIYVKLLLLRRLVISSMLALLLCLVVVWCLLTLRTWATDRTGSGG